MHSLYVVKSIQRLCRKLRGADKLKAKIKGKFKETISLEFFIEKDNININLEILFNSESAVSSVKKKFVLKELIEKGNTNLY